MNITDAGCKSFEGKSGSAFRYLLLESNKALFVEDKLFRTTPAPLPGNFPVRYEDGTGPLDSHRTFLLVNGVDPLNKDDVKGIDFAPAPLQSGNWVVLKFRGYVKDSSLTLGDDSTVVVGLPGTHTDVIGNGSQAWSIGDDGSFTVWGDFSGVGMTIGTSSATSPDDRTPAYFGSVGDAAAINESWTLRGYADVTVNRSFECADLDATILVKDNAALFADVNLVNGTWTLEDSASVIADYELHGGDWTVKDSASLTANLQRTSEDCNPEVLVIDGGSVTCWDLNRFEPPWDCTIKNGGTLTVLHDGIHTGTYYGYGSNSTLTYQGTGNLYDVDGAIIGGELISAAATADLKIESYVGLLVNPELVRVVDGVTETIRFDTEGVTVETTATNAEIETLGPDYDLSDGGPLFTDSPCVPRWKEVIIDTSIWTRLGLYYESTPITCGFFGPPCTGDYLYEALYVKDLTVNAGTELLTLGLNVYYTGTLTNNGEITIDGVTPYTPIQLNPTLYGDFDGDEEVPDDDTEGSDVDRFNDAWDINDCLTEFGEDDYDPLVDWNCDGRINEDDLAQMLANWGPLTKLEGCD